MCKPKNIENGIECIFSSVIFNMNNDDSDDSEFDDDNEIDSISSEYDLFESDPNDYSDEEFMLGQENDFNFTIASLGSLASHAVDNPSIDNDLPIIVHVEGYISDNDNEQLDNIESSSVDDSYPVIDYDLMDCELVIDHILDHIEGILNNKDKHT